MPPQTQYDAARGGAYHYNMSNNQMGYMTGGYDISGQGPYYPAQGDQTFPVRPPLGPPPQFYGNQQSNNVNHQGELNNDAGRGGGNYSVENGVQYYQGGNGELEARSNLFAEDRFEPGQSWGDETPARPAPPNNRQEQPLQQSGFDPSATVLEDPQEETVPAPPPQATAEEVQVPTGTDKAAQQMTQSTADGEPNPNEVVADNNAPTSPAPSNSGVLSPKQREKNKKKNAKRLARRKAKQQEARETKKKSSAVNPSEVTQPPPSTVTNESSLNQDNPVMHHPPTAKMLEVLARYRSNSEDLTEDDTKELGEEALTFLIALASHAAHKMGAESEYTNVSLESIHSNVTSYRLDLLLAVINDLEVTELLLEMVKKEGPLTLDENFTPMNAIDLYQDALLQGLQEGTMDLEEGVEVLSKFANRYWKQGADEIITAVRGIAEQRKLYDLVVTPGALNNFIRTENITAKFEAPQSIVLPPREYTPLKMKSAEEIPLGNETQKQFVTLTNFPKSEQRPSLLKPTKNFPCNDEAVGQSLIAMILSMKFTRYDGSIHPSPFSGAKEREAEGKISVDLYGINTADMRQAAMVILGNLQEMIPRDVSLGVGLDTSGLMGPVDPSVKTTVVMETPTSILRTPIKETSQEQVLRDPLKDLHAHQSDAWKSKSTARLQLQYMFLASRLRGYLEQFLPASPALVAYVKLMDMGPAELLRTVSPPRFNYFLTQIAHSPKKWKFGSLSNGSNQTYKITIGVKSQDEKVGFEAPLGELAVTFGSTQQSLAHDNNHEYYFLSKDPDEDGTYESVGKNEEWDQEATQSVCFDVKRDEKGNVLSFKVNVFSSYKGMSGGRHNVPLQGREANFARAKLKALGIIHYQRSRVFFGDTAAVFFQYSYLSDDKDKAKAEMMEMFPKLDPQKYRVGVSTIQIGDSSDQIIAMAVLGKKEDHDEIRSTILQMSGEGNMGRVATLGYVPVSTSQASAEDEWFLRRDMETHRKWCSTQSSVEIVGIPSRVNLYSIIPDRSPDNSETNSLSVIQLILKGPIPSPDGPLTSPLNKITPSDSPRILCHGDLRDSTKIIQYVQAACTLLPQWLLSFNLQTVPRVVTTRMDEKLVKTTVSLPASSKVQPGRRLITPSKVDCSQLTKTAPSSTSQSIRGTPKVEWSSPLESTERSTAAAADPGKVEEGQVQASVVSNPPATTSGDYPTNQVPTKFDEKLAAATNSSVSSNPPAINWNQRATNAPSKDATISHLKEQLEAQLETATASKKLIESLKEERSQLSCEGRPESTISDLKRQVIALELQLGKEQQAQNEMERKIESLEKESYSVIATQLSQEVIDTNKLLLDRLNRVGSIRTVTTIENSSAPSSMTSEQTHRTDTESTGEDIQRIMKRAFQQEAEHQSDLRKHQEEYHYQISSVKEDYESRLEEILQDVADRFRDIAERQETLHATNLLIIQRLDLLSNANEIHSGRHTQTDLKVDMVMSRLSERMPLTELEAELESRLSNTVNSFDEKVKALDETFDERSAKCKEQSERIRWGTEDHYAKDVKAELARANTLFAAGSAGGKKNVKTSPVPKMEYRREGMVDNAARPTDAGVATNKSSLSHKLPPTLYSPPTIGQSELPKGEEDEVDVSTTSEPHVNPLERDTAPATSVGTAPSPEPQVPANEDAKAEAQGNSGKPPLHGQQSALLTASAAPTEDGDTFDTSQDNGPVVPESQARTKEDGTSVAASEQVANESELASPLPHPVPAPRNEQVQLRFAEGFELALSEDSQKQLMLCLKKDEKAWPCTVGEECFNRNSNAIAMQMVLLNLRPRAMVIVVDISQEHNRVEVETIESFFQSGRMLTTADRRTVNGLWTTGRGYVPVIFVMSDGPRISVRKCSPLVGWDTYYRSTRNIMGQLRGVTLSSEDFRLVLSEEFALWYREYLQGRVVAGEFQELLMDSPGSLGDGPPPPDVIANIEPDALDEEFESDTVAQEYLQAVEGNNRDPETYLGPGRRHAEDEVRLNNAIQRSLMGEFDINHFSGAQASLDANQPIFSTPVATPVRRGNRKSGSPMGNIERGKAVTAPPRLLRRSDQSPDDSSIEKGSDNSEVIEVNHRPGQEEEWEHPLAASSAQEEATLGQSDDENPVLCEECKTGGVLHHCVGIVGRNCSYQLHENCCAQTSPFLCRWCVRWSKIGTSADSEDSSDSDRDDKDVNKPRGSKEDWEDTSSSSSDEPESPYVPKRLTAGVGESFSIGSRTKRGTGRRIIRNKKNVSTPPTGTASRVMTRSAKKRSGVNEPG